MGHKVNATSLRIRNLWNFLWYFKELKKNKKFYFNQDLLISKYLQNIYLKQNKIIFDIFIFRNLKNIIVFFKVFTFQYKTLKKKTLKKKKKKTFNRLYTYKNLPNIFNVSKHAEFYLNRFFNSFNIKLIEKNINFDNSVFKKKKKTIII